MLKTTTMEAYERATETSLSAPASGRRGSARKNARTPGARRGGPSGQAARAAARSGKWSTEELEKLDSVVATRAGTS